MDNKLKLSYFYGKEADQYSFYKIPKLLFTDSYFKSLSVESKVLYGLMLDRMSLSVKNQWLDSEGRAYIYFSLEDAMDAFVCSNKKAISIMKELDSDTGIGLIEKKRQGQGKPTIIYVKQFYIEEVQKCKKFTSGENEAVSEVKNLHVLKCKKDTSRSEEITCLEVKKVHTNKNNINNTELRYVAQCLVELKKEQDEIKDALGGEYQDYNLVMATTFGLPVGDSYIRGNMQKLIDEYDLPDVVFHSLRHTSVTYKLKLSGGDIKAVQGDSGHAQADMVTEVYGHIIDEDRRKNAELFENAFYNKEDLNPEMHRKTEKTNSIELPEGVDAETLKKVLQNPEMTALLSALAQSMNGNER